MRTVFIGAVCFMLGLGLGVWTSSMTEPEEVVAVSGTRVSGQQNEAPVEPSSVAPISVADPEDATDPEEILDASMAMDSPKQVTVSTDLIALLSQREGNRTMGQDLLDPEGAIEQALKMSTQEKTFYV